MHAGWLTLKEIDARHGAVKGTAFRAFKATLPGLVEGTDFRVLTADSAETAALRAAGRLYGATRNAVLISPAAYARIAERLPPCVRGEG